MKLKLNLNKAEARLQSRQQRAYLGHILLVDDEQENLDGLEALLSAEGYRVSATTSPQEALKLTQSHQIDLIISDQRMPVMLGTEMLSAMKSQSDDQVRVILTGYTDMNDLITCINKGLLFRYLVKPWRRDELLEVVRSGMEKIKVERTVRRLIPRRVWDQLYSGRLDEAKPGQGQVLHCAAMFIDIQRFTVISAHLTPSQTFYFLSEVMGTLQPHIHHHHGYVDKQLGDGTLVIFDRGADAARDALACAEGFNELMQRLNQPDHPLYEMIGGMMGGAPLKIGVGIHYGSVMLGTVGSYDQLEFTILGDTVNIASQIESLTKNHESEDELCVALCSAEVIKAAQWSRAESIGAQIFKGPSATLDLYRI